MAQPDNESKKKLREAFYKRLRSGIPRTEIARKTGIGQDTLYSWNQDGKGLPDLWDLQRIAEAMGVQPAWLAFGETAVSEGEQEVLAAVREFEPRQDAAVLQMIRALPMPRKVKTEGESAKPASKVQSQPVEAWQAMKGMKLKSKDFDVRSIAAPPKTQALPQPELRAAANALAVGSGVPMVAETEAADVKYSRANHFILKFVGRSMYPTMQEGDRLVVQHYNLYLPPLDEDRGAADPKPWLALDGEVVIALLDDDALDAVVKRIEVQHKKSTGFRIALRSDNPQVKSIEILAEHRLRIIGIVREIMRSPKNIG